MGFRVWGSGFRIWGLGLRVLDSGFRVEGVDRVELWLNYGLQGPLANKDTPLPRVRGQGDA